MTVTVDASNYSAFLISSQNSAVSYAAGTTQTVTWSVGNTTNAPISVANVKISWSTDNGATFTTLLASTANDGTETFTVPATLTSQARIKVEAIGNIFFDINNAPITEHCLLMDMYSVLQLMVLPDVLLPVHQFNLACKLPGYLYWSGICYIRFWCAWRYNSKYFSKLVYSNRKCNSISKWNRCIDTGHLYNCSSGYWSCSGVTQTANVSFTLIRVPVLLFLFILQAKQLVWEQRLTSALLPVVLFLINGSTVTNGGTTWNIIAGAIGSSYNFPSPTTAHNNWQFRCVVTGQCGVTNSNAAVLTVNTAPAVTGQLQTLQYAPVVQLLSRLQLPVLL
jgi:hypothetical protein